MSVRPSVKKDIVIPGNFATSKSIWKMRGAFEQYFVLRECFCSIKGFCISEYERLDMNIFKHKLVSVALFLSVERLNATNILVFILEESIVLL